MDGLFNFLAGFAIGGFIVIIIGCIMYILDEKFDFIDWHEEP